MIPEPFPAPAGPTTSSRSRPLRARWSLKGGPLMSRTWGLMLRFGAALAIFLLVLACGGGGYSPTESRGGQKTVTVNVVDFAFEPRSVTINPGDTVRWVMQGSDPHHSV